MFLFHRTVESPSGKDVIDAYTLVTLFLAVLVPIMRKRHETLMTPANPPRNTVHATLLSPTGTINPCIGCTSTSTVLLLDL